ncbi:plexin-B2-like [Ptychodera flava]|uniref:plexin-B2-like n=1 Tax=Ptychodera flava TaxID=63121 RepID=UPI003969F821
MIVPLSIKMNGNYIDDIHGYKVTLYDCSIGRRDCSQCLSELTTRLPLQCGWCKRSSSCEVKELCTSDEWLPYETTESCDDPVITEVWPLSGPYEGNTELLVRGNNLGKRFSDIVRIEVGGLPCTLIEASYSVSKSVRCTTTKSEVPNVLGNVVLHIIQAKSARSSQDFTYTDPTIHDFTPQVGPKSGGTTVTITGEFIDAGRNITANFDGFACLMKREQDVWNETTVRCKTSSVNTTSSAKLSMHFDGAERLAPDGKVFKYTEDPTVKSINPSRSMQSGGRQYNVTGTMFTAVQEPRMVFSSEDEIFVGRSCQVYSQSFMQCLSPAVYSGSLAGSEYNDFTVGFLMDAVEDLLQLDLDFTIVSDPVYYEFSEEGNIKEQRGKQLNIRGSDLNLACTAEEVHVTVGQDECRVESLSDVQLNCVPPEEEPAAVNKTGSRTRNGYPEVRVEVGYLSLYIGYLKYQKADTQTTTAIVVVSIICLLLGIVVTIGLGVILKNRLKYLDRRADLAKDILTTMEMKERNRGKFVCHLLPYLKGSVNFIFIVSSSLLLCF